MNISAIGKILQHARLSFKQIITDTPLSLTKRNYAAKTCFDQVKALNETYTKPARFMVFNIDGVILDTVQPLQEAHNLYLSKWKKTLNKKHRVELMGRSPKDVGEIVTKEFDLPVDAAVYDNGIWNHHRDYFRSHKVKPMKRVDEFICYFKDNNIPVALISNSNSKEFQLKTKAHQDLLSLFCHIVLADDRDVLRGFPHPDLYEVAAARFKNAPKTASEMYKVLAFDSSISGVRAAKAGGLQTVLFPDKQIPKDLYKEADVVINSFVKFEPVLFDLPKLKMT